MIKLGKNTGWHSGATFIFVACLGACSVTSRFDLVESANKELQQRVRLKRYSEIYDSSTPAFRESTTRAQLSKLLDTINRKLGNCDAGVPGVKTAGWTSGGSVATVNYTLHCANGELYESISWQVVDGKPLLTNLSVSSSLLSID
jgi:hypothetical protein